MNKKLKDYDFKTKLTEIIGYLNLNENNELKKILKQQIKIDTHFNNQNYPNIRQLVISDELPKPEQMLDYLTIYAIGINLNLDILVYSSNTRNFKKVNIPIDQ
jgi:hypothetical protein